MAFCFGLLGFPGILEPTGGVSFTSVSVSRCIPEIFASSHWLLAKAGTSCYPESATWLNQNRQLANLQIDELLASRPVQTPSPWVLAIQSPEV